MKRRSKRVERAMDFFGEVGQMFVQHTSRKTPKFLREGEHIKQIERISRELVKKKKV